MGVSKLGAWTSNAGQTTITRTVSDGHRRMVLVVIQTRNGSSTLADVTSVDYGGEAMTKLVDASVGAANKLNLEIWYILEASLKERTDDVITPTYDNSPNQSTLAAVVFRGVNQKNPFEENNSDATNSSTPNPLTTIDLVGAIDNFGIGAVAYVGSGNVTWQADLTERVDVVDIGSGQSIAELPITSAGNITVEGTVGTQVRAVGISAEVRFRKQQAYESNLIEWLQQSAQKAIFGTPTDQDIEDSIINLNAWVDDSAKGNSGWESEIVGTALNGVSDKLKEELMVRIIAERLTNEEEL